MSADSAVSIAWDVFKMGFAPIKRGFGYVMSSDSYADNLQKEVENLVYEAQRVRNAEEEARNDLRKIHEWVAGFLASAEEALKEAKDLLGEFDKASKTCCCGTLPDPNCCYQFSRKAKHKTDEIKNLILEKSNKEISFSGPASGKVSGPTPDRREGKEVFDSREKIIQNIMDALADDTKSVVGVHGMGGVGKSTLLADAEKRIREKKPFDWVAKADVSENPDIHTIQKEIALCLGLSPLDKEQEVSTRAKLLRERLEKEEREKKKVLIIMDNLWERLDLDKVGIPCGHDNKAIGCKLLLTSRDERLLRRGMRCDSAFLLGVLQEEEAKRLFEKMVGGKALVELETLVDEALRISSGLPFLIVAISNLFIDTSYSECEYALKQICNKEPGEAIDDTINDINERIHNTLRVSYDRIKSEKAKSLLRLCVAYGVSKPSLEYLVRYGVGLRIFGEVSTMQEARGMLLSLIRTLRASSLLSCDEDDANGFKIHDLVRAFVTSIASRDHPLLVLKDKDDLVTKMSEDRLKSCEAICFPYVDLEELPEKLNCPELQIFMLFKNNKPLEVRDSYFNSMKSLMALHLTGICLNRSPSPFQLLKNLQSLCLDYCSIKDVAILGELKGLQILSLQNSDISRLPKKIGQLTELRLLDLDNCSKLHIIEPGMLGKLTKLEELYMNDSFDKWNASELTPATNACLIELNDMKKLCTLDASIPDPRVLPKDLDVEKLTKYRIRIGDVGRWNEYRGSRTLELMLDPASDVLQRECIKSILHKIDKLFLEELNGIEQSICWLSQKGFPELKHLQVKNSPSIRYVLERSPLIVFKTLETILLKHLIKLVKICHNHISTESFRTLKVIQVEGCDKVEVLFPRSVMRELSQLEKIKVVRCELMRGIVEVDDDHGKFELPKLRVLELGDLPNIENFMTTGSSPSSSTPNDQVGTQIAFFNGQQVAFPSLETLKVNGLDNLEFMFSPSMVKSLAQLRKLTINNCTKIEAIITDEEGLGEEISETLSFPMLTDLCLYWLESLTCFSRKKCSREGRSQDDIQLHSRVLFNQEVDFPKLETLEVSGLDNLEFIFYPLMVKSLTQLRKLSVWYCEKMEAIITDEEGWGMEASETLTFSILTDLRLGRLGSLTCLYREKCSREGRSQDGVQSHSNALFNREVSFPLLESLILEELPNIKEIWSDDESPLEPSNLRSLKVVRCESLSKVISSRSLVKLYKLQTLCINDCSSVQENFDLEGAGLVDILRLGLI